MAFAAGTRVGAYEVTSLIGAGGMGEVYRAHDSSLHRDVALKVLPDVFAADPERLARFKREALVLASLNHPNIAAIYGFAEGQALVMELVEGPTLADRIAQGPVPLDEALPIARQIADALQSAHDRGIVHRDLKPANIKLRPDGTAKVLDFGLAKAFEGESAASPTSTISPTITSPAATALGVILGTAAYMSPEQARGKTVDRRTDIWAFGCVLYEMLVGRRIFEGDEVSDVLAFILTTEPGWSALPPGTPTAIRRLLRRCLQKDRGRRLDSAADARIEIDEALTAPSDAERQVPHLGMLRRLGVAWATASAFAIALLAVLASSWLGIDATRELQDAQPIRFVVSPPEGWTWRLGGTTGTTGIAPMAISPDGRRLAVEAANSEGTTQIWIRSLESLDAQPLAGTIGGFAPFWSPDSRFVGFFADGKLKKVDTSGGAPITLCDAPIPQGGSWSQDGVIVFAPTVNSALQKVSASGGVPTSASSLTEGETGHRRPWFLPDGRHFLFSANAPAAGQRPVYLAAVDSPDRTELLRADSANVSYSQGHLLYRRGNTLMAHPFDAQRLQLTGEPVPVAEEVQANGAIANALFSVSDTAVLVYSTGNSQLGQLLWFDRAGKPLGVLGDWGAYHDLELAPDGKRASVTLPDPSRGGRDIWIFETERGLRTRFSFDQANESSSAWSPDGSELVFSSDRRGHVDLYRKRSNGSGSEEALFEDDRTKWVQSWSPDGGAVLFFTAAADGTDLFVLPLTGARKPTALQQTPFSETRGRFSPDGRWIAYQSNESGRAEVYVASLAAAGGKWQISTTGGGFPRWRRDGSEIFYLAADNRLMAASVNGRGSSFEVGMVTPLFLTRAPAGGYQYDVSADGQRFLVNSVREADSTPVTVVVNWTAALNK